MSRGGRASHRRARQRRPGRHRRRRLRAAGCGPCGRCRHLLCCAHGDGQPVLPRCLVDGRAGAGWSPPEYMRCSATTRTETQNQTQAQLTLPTPSCCTRLAPRCPTASRHKPKLNPNPIHPIYPPTRHCTRCHTLQAPPCPRASSRRPWSSCLAAGWALGPRALQA